MKIVHPSKTLIKRPNPALDYFNDKLREGLREGKTIIDDLGLSIPDEETGEVAQEEES